MTLLELLIVVSILGTLATMAIPMLAEAIEHTRNARAIADLRAIQLDLTGYEVRFDTLPEQLDELQGREDLLDPWGNPYQYLNFSFVQGMGAKRKDQFLVPINSTYDLYSMGKDGESQPSLAPPVSRDDILRANDGAYLGLASQF